MSESLFDTPAPRLFTLPPQADFLRSIARRLRLEFNVETHPDALTRVLILTPTRRAAKALGDAFAEEAGTGVALLPMIRPLGDIDVDDPPFEPGELAGIAPPAVSASRRRFELARLILAKEAALGREIGIGGALALAEPLGALLDDLATEDVTDLSVLDEALKEHLPADRREAVEFLNIVGTIWPMRLKELGLVDSAARRSIVLGALVERWDRQPPSHPVLVVGSTGSIPAARDVMRCVAQLPQGAVVLPGFDWDADDKAWEHIDDSHPQWAMKAFVSDFGIHRKQVRQWPGSAEDAPARARRRVIAESLRPAKATDDWLDRVEQLKQQYGEDYFARGLDGLSLVEAPDLLAEARICALLLRETLDTPGKTAILVTPDRGLARRVAAEMDRFGVRLDDSGGAALSETHAGAFLLRLLDVAEDPGSVVALSALWGSPLFAAGLERGLVHGVLGKFEAEALRGVRPGRDLAAVRARLDGKYVDLFDDDRAAIEAILTQMQAAMAPLEPDEQLPAAVWAERHARAAEALASSAEREGAVRLWAGEGGDAAAGVLRELLGETESLPPMRLFEYAGAFRELVRARRVPPRLGVHPRLQVLGPLEARLIGADRIVLAGLNEGVWPAGLGVDPWLSAGMRKVLELGAPERRHGLAAHDFAQLACGAEVFLTRATKADGAPTVASRWVWRLKTLVEGAMGRDAAGEALEPAEPYAAIARDLNAPGLGPKPAPKPEPRPRVSARPRGLSITEIRTWVRDPYSIYARRILGINRLDPADMPIGARERGTALHDALEEAFADWLEVLPEDAEAQLVEVSRRHLVKAGFAPEELVVELPRFARAARWLIAWERVRRAEGITIAKLEVRGSLVLNQAGGDWVLSGRSDRFDRRADGRLDVIDYKTGTAAKPKVVAAGFDPQLPLTAAMARVPGVFEGLNGEPAGLYYVRLPGNAEGGEEAQIHSMPQKKPVTPPADEMAAKALEDLREWIDRFDRETEPYLSQPRAQYVNDYGDYDHLARRGEWASAPGGGDEGGET
ncbi:double-strand break repair protein AddB [Maricaulis salignorans]|uniref:ATP-dependent helicase/nuclease subunit B n=1 Tax=Maricaulis salignorans TaxID=144026 RepID=A0A1G9SUP0_9PROT|nr:double-strand break repair protein AddB [Maricaulis salignorans]SDM38565.1 ATP-dependent helicase/nuclease subunit B [Maricaulis salignorans]